MKRLLIATAAFAAMTGVASAQNTNTANTEDTQEYTISARAEPRCAIDGATTATVTQDMVNDNGRVRPNLSNNIAQALNDTNTFAWCSGVDNQVNAFRTALVLVGSDGEPDDASDPFNEAVIYDLFINVAGSGPEREGDDEPLEGTSDGEGLGPTQVGRFGATGQGRRIRFSEEDEASAVSSDSPGTGARSAYSALENNARLAAGNYEGTFTITLTPGV